MSVREAEHREVEKPFPGVFSIVTEDGDARKDWVRFGFTVAQGSMKISDVYDRAWPTSIVYKENRINGGLEKDEIKVYILTSERREDRKKIKNVYRISYKRPDSSETQPQPILRNSNAFAILNQSESEFNLNQQWTEETKLRIGQPIPFSWGTEREERTSGPIEEIVITSGKAHHASELEDMFKDPNLPRTDVLREYMRRRRAGESKRAQA